MLLTVAPWYGAKLTTMKLWAQGAYHEVLWPISEEDLLTNAWFKQSILFPYPNRLQDGRYVFEGKSYQLPVNEPATNNQLHGLLFNAPFEVVSAQASGEEAIIKLRHDYDGQEAGYPFPFSFEVVYRYFGHGLEVSFQVNNTGEGRLPFGIGWHPYFQIDGHPVADHVFRCDDLEEVELGDRSLPTGRRRLLDFSRFELHEHKLDNAYQLKSPNITYDLLTGDGLVLSISATGELDYLQLFTPDGGQTIAIEPMSCNVNALNNKEGLKTLDSGSTFRCNVNLELK